MQLQTIEAKVDPNNRSAISLMEHFGFTKEAHYKNRIYFKESYRDMAVLTLHRESFKLPSFEKL